MDAVVTIAEGMLRRNPSAEPPECYRRAREAVELLAEDGFVLKRAERPPGRGPQRASDTPTSKTPELSSR